MTDGRLLEVTACFLFGDLSFLPTALSTAISRYSRTLSTLRASKACFLAVNEKSCVSAMLVKIARGARPLRRSAVLTYFTYAPLLDPLPPSHRRFARRIIAARQKNRLVASPVTLPAIAKTKQLSPSFARSLAVVSEFRQEFGCEIELFEPLSQLGEFSISPKLQGMSC